MLGNIHVQRHRNDSQAALFLCGSLDEDLEMEKQQKARTRTWLCASCLLFRRWVLTPVSWAKIEKGERPGEDQRRFYPD